MSDKTLEILDTIIYVMAAFGLGLCLCLLVING